MIIDVIVLLRETTEEIAVWRYETDPQGRLCIMDGRGNDLTSETSWERLALGINQRACDNSSLPVDVFLILRDPLVENLDRPDTLVEIVNHARDHTWGGAIYLVWDQSEVKFVSLYRNHKDELKKWFSMLAESGVTDLVEVKKRHRLTEPDERKILYQRGLESRRRWEGLRGLISSSGWRVVLREDALFLDDFLKEFKVSELPSPKGGNLAVFYDQPPKWGWYQLLKASRVYGQGGKRFVAVLSRSKEKDLWDLRGMWEQESPGIELFVYKGIFEWLYAFIRLAHAGRHSPPAQPPDLTHEALVWVEPVQKVPPDPEPGGDARLLITSAFALRPAGENAFYSAAERELREAEELQAKYCLDAVKEVGGVLRNLPFHVEVEVRHCVTAERLPDFLEGRAFTAWLHLGHGDRRGLFEELTNRHVSSQRWLDCFDSYESSLRLVIFSACESADLARSFVEAGVARVAIGFENPVLTAATRNLSGQVMPAALGEGDRQDSILHAFLKSFISLRRYGYEEQGEDRHYSDAGPRAFVARRTT
ncbi:MAG: hypothetical protein ABW250_01395 [Pyrinomonadaceae bacterium]